MTKITNKLLQVTASKKSIIISVIISLIVLGLLVSYTVFFYRLYLDPISHFDYLYLYGYGIYARNYSIFLGVLSILWIVLMFFICRKQVVNITIPRVTIMPLFILITAIGFVVIVKENRSVLSYTNSLEHYGFYDEIIANEMKELQPLLPERDKIIRYEYILFNNSSIFGSFYEVTISMELNFDDTIYEEVKAKENFHLMTEAVEDQILKDYEIYKAYITLESLPFDDKQEINNIYYFFNIDNNRMFIFLVSGQINPLKMT